MTISPPAKVKTFELPGTEVLVSGIDTLELTYEIEWDEENCFQYLSDLKKLAIENKCDMPGTLMSHKDLGEWHFQTKPHGKDGHEWWIYSREFDLLIGNWRKPKSRPSVQVKIRSEALWRLGIKECVAGLEAILKGNGAKIISTKVSRVDLCVDALMPEKIWEPELINYKATRARKEGMFKSMGKLQGFSIGQGKISARLYDKPLEIEQQSKKYWMYDIWKIQSVPEGKRVIRTEFQIRREALKSLNIDSIESLFKHQGNLWAYSSQNWLKFSSNPGKHHTQRKVLDFWEKIQNGYKGSQKACPLIRRKILGTTKKQLCLQAYGLLTSLCAVDFEQNQVSMDQNATILNGVETLINEMEGHGKTKESFGKDVTEKRIKFRHFHLKDEEAFAERRAKGLPSGKDYTKEYLQ